jgi:flagella basal body P-ring formation protein FlgA
MRFRSALFAAALAGLLLAGGLRADLAPDALDPVRPDPRPPLVEANPDQILLDLAHQLHGRFHLEGELDLEFASVWSPPECRAREWKVTVVEFPAAATGAMLVRFRLCADGAPQPDATLMLRASLWRDAWFTQEPMPSGAELEVAQLESRRVDYFRARDAIPAVPFARDFVTIRPLPAGAMLSWRDVGNKPLVRKGEMVEVSAVQGMLHVAMKALALQSGARGEIVNVRNPESLKIIPAVVVSENCVAVRL